MKKWNEKLQIVLGLTLVMGLLTGCGAGQENKDALVGTDSDGGAGLVVDTVKDLQEAPAEDAGKLHVAELELSNYLELPDYANLVIEVEAAAPVDQAYLDYVVSYMYSNMANAASTDNMITNRAVENGDLISLDYCGKRDGVAFDGGTAEGATLWIGSGSFIDGFEAGLVGVMPGETVDLNLRFPDAYGNAELAGAEVVFTCTVHGIIPEEDVLAVWNASVFDDAELVHNMDEFRAYFEKALMEENNAEREQTISDEVINRLLADVTEKMQFPTSMVEKYQQQAQNMLESIAANNNMEKDAVAQNYFGMTEEAFYTDYSHEQMLIDAVLTQIGKEQKLELDDAAFNERLQQLAMEYGLENPEDAFESMEECRLYFMKLDVLDYLLDTVTVNDK